MRTGVSYMGHHIPRHIEADIRAMRDLQLDDVLVCAQENDFAHFTGKIEFTPRIAKDHGLRPIAIFWGALNLFGGGRSSQFLLENPGGFQVRRDGSHWPEGCYVNPSNLSRVQDMIDRVVELGFEGYFVDEPTPLRGCFCPSCRAKYEAWYDEDLMEAPEASQAPAAIAREAACASRTPCGIALWPAPRGSLAGPCGCSDFISRSRAKKPFTKSGRDG